MNDRINKTSICSIVFLDIIDYSRRPDAEQIDVKNQFNALINHALKDFAQNDRIILDTGDGAAIAYMGSPEDALFMAMGIRDSVLKNNESGSTLMHVRFGINLGPVRVVQDINGRPNIIGDGINVAQRIMTFAQPNQILVSRSYYEITSRLTQEISQMFDYSGVKHDKHVRDHEVYSVRSTKDSAKVDSPEEVTASDLPSINQVASASKINWNYAAPAVFVLVALFAIGKLAFAPKPTDMAKAANKPVAAKVAEPIKPATTDAAKPAELAKAETTKSTEPTKSALANNEAAKDTAEQKEIAEQKKVEDQKKIAAKKKAKLKAKPVEKPVPQQSVPQKTDVAQNPNTHNKQEASSHTQAKAGRYAAKPIIIHEPEKKCTQAEIAMNVCR